MGSIHAERNISKTFSKILLRKPYRCDKRLIKGGIIEPQRQIRQESRHTMKRNIPLMSEEQVLKHLGKKDFRSLDKKTTIEFVSSINQMDPQVALGIIEKFPEIAQFGLNIAKEQTEQLKAALASNDESVKAQYEQTKMVAEVLKSVVENENSTPEERIEAMRGLNDVIEHNERIDKRNKDFLIKIIRNGAIGLGSVAVLVLGAIGLNSRGSLPDFSDRLEDE